MAHAHLGRHAELLQTFFLREQVATELGAGSQEPIDIFLEPDEIGVNGGRLRHDVQERNRRAHAAAATFPVN